jgi:hypothetical protein
MPTWIVKCPKCETEKEISAADVAVNCGRVTYTCTCTNCRHEFDSEQPYWRWLGLKEAPPGVAATHPGNHT